MVGQAGEYKINDKYISLSDQSNSFNTICYRDRYRNLTTFNQYSIIAFNSKILFDSVLFNYSKIHPEPKHKLKLVLDQFSTASYNSTLSTIQDIENEIASTNILTENYINNGLLDHYHTDYLRENNTVPIGSVVGYGMWFRKTQFDNIYNSISDKLSDTSDISGIAAISAAMQFNKLPQSLLPLCCKPTAVSVLTSLYPDQFNSLSTSVVSSLYTKDIFFNSLKYTEYNFATVNLISSTNNTSCITSTDGLKCVCTNKQYEDRSTTWDYKQLYRNFSIDQNGFHDNGGNMKYCTITPSYSMSDINNILSSGIFGNSIIDYDNLTSQNKEIYNNCLKKSYIQASIGPNGNKLVASFEAIKNNNYNILDTLRWQYLYPNIPPTYLKVIYYEYTLLSNKINNSYTFACIPLTKTITIRQSCGTYSKKSGYYILEAGTQTKILQLIYDVTKINLPSTYLTDNIFYFVTSLMINTACNTQLATPAPITPIAPTQPTIFTFPIVRPLSHTTNTISATNIYNNYKVDFNDMVFHQTYKLYKQNDTNSNTFGNEKLSLSANSSEYNTVIPLSTYDQDVVKLTFFPVAPLQNENSLAFICYHAGNNLISGYNTLDKSKEQYINNVSVDSDLSFCLSSATMNHLCSSLFINYIINLYGLHSLLACSESNYYAKIHGGTDSNSLTYYLSFCLANKEISNYSGFKNNQLSSRSYIFDNKLFNINKKFIKTFLFYKTIITCFNTYINTLGMTSHNYLLPNINDNNTTYINSNSFTKDLFGVKFNQNATLVEKYTYGHYNVSLSAYNIPYKIGNFNNIKLSCFYENENEPDTNNLFQQKFNLTYYSSIFNTINLDEINLSSQYLATLNDNLLNTNIQGYYFKPKDIDNISAFAYKSYIYLPGIYSLSSIEKACIDYAYIDSYTSEKTSLYLIKKQFKYPSIFQIKDYISAVINSCLLNKFLYLKWYNKETENIAATQIVIPYIQNIIYQKNDENYILGYTIQKIESTAKNKEEFKNMLSSYNNLYKFTFIKVLQLTKNILKPLNTEAALMSYSQLLNTPQFIYGYGTHKVDTTIIKQLNNSLSENNINQVLSGCFQATHRIEYSQSGVLDLNSSLNFNNLNFNELIKEFNKN